MDHHQGVLQQRIQPLAVEGRLGQLVEGVFGEDENGQEQDRRGHEGGNDVRHQFPVAVQVLRHGDGAVQGQNPQPQQHGSLLPAPQGGNEVKERHGEVGNTGDVLNAEIVGQDGKKQRKHRDGNQGEHTERRPFGAANHLQTPGANPDQGRDNGIKGSHKSKLQGRAADIVHDRSSCFIDRCLVSS